MAIYFITIVGAFCSVVEVQILRIHDVIKVSHLSGAFSKRQEKLVLSVARNNSEPASPGHFGPQLAATALILFQSSIFHRHGIGSYPKRAALGNILVCNQ
ncbi:hypothetical protein DSO57_1004942 [Entomophthora muscae]|uniref:Uncharacterized protein n=1 Tax=Entomophthora muscae TaxID=34485 RepID=A0ACC2T809_9FUNG|nr:hypothetical protein DSO57_1004942 [Entomophthora muscae]